MKKLVALLIPIAFMVIMQANAQSTLRVDHRQHH